MVGVVRKADKVLLSLVIERYVVVSLYVRVEG